MSDPPKALLFDIGGVCVVSPFQAILDYELANSIPAGYVNFAISRTGPNGSWHQLERGEIPMDAAWFAAFNADLRRPDLWAAYYAKSHGSFSVATPPPIPNIDGEWLFWEMMRVSRAPDPYIHPALLKLKASGKFLLAALSNTTIFPPGHPYNEVQDAKVDVRAVFEVYVSSAHVGMRKPEKQIYELALERMREKRPGLKAAEVVFTDDIGENVKVARALGMRTVKVTLGKTRDTVKELERITGLNLLDEDVKGKL